MAKSNIQKSYWNTCSCKLRRNMKVPASRYWRHWSISPLMETPNICPMLEVRGHIPFIQHCIPDAKTICFFVLFFDRGSNCFEQNGMNYNWKWLKLKGAWYWGMPFSLRFPFIWEMLQFKVRLVCGRLIDSGEIKTYFIRLVWNIKSVEMLQFQQRPIKYLDQWRTIHS